ncbi:MAG: hypothetical protein ACRCX2_05975 [Paraclostridium sp.]
MKVRENDIVQVNESHEWVGCLVHVTKVKNWGVQGFVYIPFQGQAHIRLEHDEYEIIGQAKILPETEED